MQTCKHTHGCKMWPNKMNLYIHKPMQEACGIPFLFSKIRRTLLSTAALEGLTTLQCMIHQQYSSYSYPSGIKSGGEGMELGGGNRGGQCGCPTFVPIQAVSGTRHSSTHFHYSKLKHITHPIDMELNRLI